LIPRKLEESLFKKLNFWNRKVARIPFAYCKIICSEAIVPLPNLP
jgi:hypothetical protein